MSTGPGTERTQLRLVLADSDNRAPAENRKKSTRMLQLQCPDAGT